MPSPKGSFVVGDLVRYTPATYGYEDALDPDGCVPGVVLGYTPRGRVQVELTLAQRGGSKVRRAVDAGSLTAGSTGHVSDVSEVAEP